LALTRGLHLGITQQLPTELRGWYSITRKLNGWFTDDTGLQLYQQKDHAWSTFMPLLQCWWLRSFISTAISLTAQEPLQLRHATVYQRGHTITITGHGLILPESEHNNTDAWQQLWPWWNCKLSSEGNEVQQPYKAARLSLSAMALIEINWGRQHG